MFTFFLNFRKYHSLHTCLNSKWGNNSNHVIPSLETNQSTHSGNLVGTHNKQSYTDKWAKRYYYLADTPDTSGPSQQTKLYRQTR